MIDVGDKYAIVRIRSLMPRSRRSIAVMARCLVVLVLAGGTAAASPPGLTITGDACDLSGLDNAPLSRSTTVSVHIDMSVADRRVVARLSVEGGDGKPTGARVVAADTCAELIDSLALILDMTLPTLDEPAAASATAEANPSPHPAPVLAPVTAFSADQVESATDLRRAASRIDMVIAGAGGDSSHGLQEQLLVGARWRRDDRSIGAELRLEPPTSEQVSAVGHIHVVTAALTASPCVHRGGFAACLLATAGVITGYSDGLMAARTAVTPLLAGGARLTWEHAMSQRLALRLNVDFDANATATRFDVDHMAVWASDRLELWAGAGVIAHFP